ncbi:MAG: hypothetical protein AMJ43_01340 [Coxiella sp. DG_40]|nr:MAG: hypothetical protein AMJ43_01340 [Coxiella sp. DG_40]
MSRIILRIFSRTSLIIIAVFGLSIGPMQLAKAQAPTAGMPVTVAGLSGGVVKALYQLYKKALSEIYNKALVTYKDLIYETDWQIPPTTANNANRKTAEENASEAVKKDSADEVANDFAGIRARTEQQIGLLTKLAGDDVISGEDKGGVFSKPPANLKARNEQAMKGNAIFDVESLLGPNTYKNTEEINDAENFLDQVKSYVSPPPVIRLAPKFDVPISDPEDPSKDVVTIGGKKPLSIKDIKKLYDMLQTKPDYQEYKRTYRGIVAARSIYLDNLRHSFQKRVAQVGGKSALQIRNEQTDRRLDEKYYNEMAKASPATVARETLFVLAEINSQLNAIREQNERMIIMDSINGLNQLAVSNTMLDLQAKKVGEIIYCNDPKHEKETICTGPSENESTEALGQ